MTATHGKPVIVGPNELRVQYFMHRWRLRPCRWRTFTTPISMRGLYAPPLIVLLDGWANDSPRHYGVVMAQQIRVTLAKYPDTPIITEAEWPGNWSINEEGELR